MRVPVLQGRYRGPTGGGRRNASGGSQMQEALAAAGRAPRQAVTQLPQSGGRGVAPRDTPADACDPVFGSLDECLGKRLFMCPWCNDVAVPARGRGVAVV